MLKYTSSSGGLKCNGKLIITVVMRTHLPVLLFPLILPPAWSHAGQRAAAAAAASRGNPGGSGFSGPDARGACSSPPSRPGGHARLTEQPGLTTFKS